MCVEQKLCIRKVIESCLTLILRVNEKEKNECMAAKKKTHMWLDLKCVEVGVWVKT